jgi:hypothetical protein
LVKLFELYSLYLATLVGESERHGLVFFFFLLYSGFDPLISAQRQDREREKKREIERERTIWL